MTDEQFQELKQVLVIHVKRWLTKQEAILYTQFAQSTFYRKCGEYGVYANGNGFYDKEELDEIMSGHATKIKKKADKIKIAR